MLASAVIQNNRLDDLTRDLPISVIQVGCCTNSARGSKDPKKKKSANERRKEQMQGKYNVAQICLRAACRHPPSHPRPHLSRRSPLFILGTT